MQILKSILGKLYQLKFGYFNLLDFVLSLNASGDVFVVNFFTCLNDYRTRGRDIRSSAFKNEMCIDSVEQPTGSDVELYECHGEGRNQVNFSSFCMLITSFAGLKFANVCLNC